MIDWHAERAGDALPAHAAAAQHVDVLGALVRRIVDGGARR